LEVGGIRLGGKAFVSPQRRPMLEFLWERMEQEIFEDDALTRHMRLALLAPLLLELARGVGKRCCAPKMNVTKIPRGTIEQLCAELRADLPYPWTTEELIRRSGYGATQLRSLFVTMTGATPMRWLQQERVLHARDLLAQTDKTVMEIAMEVGFGDRSLLYRALRKLLKTSPSRYRAIMRHDH